MNSQKKQQYDDLISNKLRKLLRDDYVRGQLSAEFIEVTSQLHIARLDYWERVFRHEIWQTARPWSPSYRLLSNSKQPVRIPLVDCCSGDGHKREEALRRLDVGAPSGFLLALVLRRLNDWVPEVRAAAREHIPLVANETEPEHVLEALWGVLPHLHTWGRLQAEDKEALFDIIGNKDISLRLSEKIITASSGPAPAIFGQAGRHPAFDSCLLDISARAVQPAVRAKAYKSQLDEYVTWIEGYQWVWIDKRWCKGKYEPILGKRKIQVARPFIESLRAAATDQSALVRRVAGNALFTMSDEVEGDAVAIAEMLARDPSSSVAERGKFALKKVSG